MTTPCVAEKKDGSSKVKALCSIAFILPNDKYWIKFLLLMSFECSLLDLWGLAFTTHRLHIFFVCNWVALDVIFTNIGAISLLFTRRSDRQLRVANWNANWIFIFSHKGDESEWEKGFGEWPCLSASFFSSFISSYSIPHATSQSLSPIIFSAIHEKTAAIAPLVPPPKIPSGSIRSSRLCARPPLADIIYSCLEGHVVPVWTNGRGGGGQGNIVRGGGRENEEAGGRGGHGCVSSAL